MKTLLMYIRKTGASLFFTGYFPFASGTIASALVVLAMWLFKSKINFLSQPQFYFYYWFAMIAVIAVSVFLSDKSKEVFGSDDSSKIVIDEVAGQIITFFMIPLTFRTLILGLVLFRFFDIVKPFPVHKMEEMDGGLGVTMDDVAAGVMANVSLMLILALYHWIRQYLY